VKPQAAAPEFVTKKAADLLPEDLADREQDPGRKVKISARLRQQFDMVDEQ